MTGASREAVTELGVDEVLAWQASRSIVRWDQGKAEKGVAKWQATVRESSKQARRLSVPVVTAVATSQVCERIRDAACAFVLHEDAEECLYDLDLPAGPLTVVVGPEGGLSGGEVLALRVERDTDGVVQRALMCEGDSSWLAKDRSGKLGQWMEPDLGAVIKTIGGVANAG